MKHLRRFLVKFYLLFSNSKVEAELAREIGTHLALLEDEYLRQGMTAEEARRAARIACGGLEQAMQLHRDERGFQKLSQILQDTRYTFRQLHKSPGFAAVAILTLALGMGASAIIFSVVYNGVLYPFPYRSAERLTAISVQDVEHPDRGRGMYHLDEVAAFRNGNHSFEDILGYGIFHSLVYTRGKTNEMLNGAGMTPNAEDFWGVAPMLGRWFGKQDVRTGAPLVVLLNYNLWNREFHGDKSVLGSSILLNGKWRTIIGVMPRRFQAVGADLYLPVSWTRPEPSRSRFDWDIDDPIEFWATGILKRDVSFETAQADIDVIARQLARQHPDDYPKKFRITMTFLNDVVVGHAKQTWLLLFAAVGLLLFISCSNVAGLLVAKASARTKEISLRVALGASRMRLVQQLMSETLVLAGASCILGCVIAYGGLKLLMATNLSPLPWEAEVAVNRPVLVFAIGMSLFSAMLCGIAPALHAVRRDLQQRLASSAVNVDSAHHHSRFRSGLVIGQVALSLLLLTCAGLVTRSFLALIYHDPDVEPNKIFVAELHFPSGRYTKPEEKKTFFDHLLGRLDAMPGVSDATALQGMPLLFSDRGDVTIPGKPHRDEWPTDIQLCSENYFQTVGLHLLRGRLLMSADISGERHVAVVNQKLAQKYFPGENPMGQQIKFNTFDQLPESPRDAYFEIVGVVNNTRSYDLEDAMLVPRGADMTLPMMFVPYSVSGFGNRDIAMRTEVPPASLVNSVRQMVWSLDPNVVLVEPQIFQAAGFSLSDMMRGLVYGKQELAALAFGTCALLGFALAIIGLFSVMTYIVTLKTHDIGIRLSMGASQGAILQMTVRQGLALTSAGITIGLLASVGITHCLSTQFRGISATDLLTFVVVVVAVMLAGLSACFFPARRAARVDPMVALRYE